MITFNCPSCGQKYNVPDEKAGVRAKCKKCGGVMQVPDAMAMAAAAAPAAAHGGFELENPPPSQPMARPVPRPQDRTSTDTILRGRPFSATDEIAKRSRAIFTVGIILIVSFFLPILGGRGSLSFLNIEMLGASGVPILAKLMLLYPLIAGIAILAIARTVIPPVRGYAMIGIGLLPMVINLIDPDTLRLFQSLGPNVGSIGLMMLLFYLGIAGVYVGARARWYRPNMSHAYVIGTVGGIMLCLFFIIPIQGQVIIAAPFMIMGDSVATGLGILIGFGLLIASAVICMGNTTGKSPENASAVASAAFRCLVGAAIIMPVTLMLMGIIAAFSAPSSGGIMAIGILLTVVKMAGWIGSIYLLLPMGLTDVLVGQPNTNPKACSACGYDLSGGDSGTCPECGHNNW